MKWSLVSSQDWLSGLVYGLLAFFLANVVVSFNFTRDNQLRSTAMLFMIMAHLVVLDSTAI